MTMVELSIEKAFMFIEPGPVLLLTTNDDGKNNIMTLSWHMVMNFTPRIARRESHCQRVRGTTRSQPS